MYQFLFVDQIIFILIITMIKISILNFYRRIFASRRITRVTSAIIALCLIWGIICLFLVIFQCKPIAAAWDLTYGEVPTSCIDSNQIHFGFEISNFLIDVVILSLSVNLIRRFQIWTSASLRAGIIAVFLLGTL